MALKIYLILFLVSFTASLALADDDFSKETYKVTPIESSVFMLEGAGGNITASIGKDGVLLVDADFFEMAEKLKAKLLELKGREPRIIINTHFHYDHTGGNRAFPLATIIAAQAVRDRLSTEQVLWKKNHPAVHEGLPNVTFEDKLKLYFNGEQVDVVHLKNGHTDGDTVVVFENAKVASLGDLYFSGMYPIFHPEHQGSLSHYVKNIESALKLLPEGATIIPGHGPLSNKKELVVYAEMIRDSIKTVKSGIKRGLSLEMIITRGLDSRWDSYSHGYRNTAQWITSIYESCRKKDCR